MVSLDLRYSSIGTAGLAALGGMTKLVSLKLSGARVDNLEPIRNLNALEILYLNGNPLDDAALAPIAGFSALKDLELMDTNVTGPGFAYLAGLPALAVTAPTYRRWRKPRVAR